VKGRAQSGLALRRLPRLGVNETSRASRPVPRNSSLQHGLHSPTLQAVKKESRQCVIVEGHCPGTKLCPLSRVKAGAVVCIKELAAAPDVSDRLRELGFCKDQQIKLVARESNFICQICNARLAISEKLARSILVEAVPVPAAAI